ncbi:MAG: hypothetical protein ACJAT7_001495 [Psychromonas sp.]|jgi:hypothetical protein
MPFLLKKGWESHLALFITVTSGQTNYATSVITALQITD